MDPRKAIVILVIAMAAETASAQVTSDLKDVQVAKKQLRIGIDTAKYFTSILHTISAAATHRQSPTAKAVYDYVQTVVASGVSDGDKGDITVSSSGTNWQIDANAVGASEIASGAVGSSELAQQGATTGQVLRWSGSAWTPDGTNMYQIVTASGSIGAQYNEVWIGTISGTITLNLPACNTGNDGVRIEIAKSGTDNFGVVVEPAGSEVFSDGETEKTIYSPAIGISCTCNGAGVWLLKF